MPPIVLTAVQALFLLLLYWFVARAVRAVIRDVRAAGRVPAARPAPAARRPPGRRTGAGERRSAPAELVVHVPDERPRVVPLDAHDVTFGRADLSTIQLDDPYVSDHHAKVYFDQGEWRVVDLGSTNGTYLNQVRVTSPSPLSAGDQVAIGKTVVQVRR